MRAAQRSSRVSRPKSAGTTAIWPCAGGTLLKLWAASIFRKPWVPDLSAILENHPVRLELLEQRHIEPLRAACSEDREIWQIYPVNMLRSEEHTSELQPLMRISYAVFCLKKKK